MCTLGSRFWCSAQSAVRALRTARCARGSPRVSRSSSGRWRFTSPASEPGRTSTSNTTSGAFSRTSSLQHTHLAAPR